MSELNISVVIMRENMLISGEIYTTGKNFTLPLAVTAMTNITSVYNGNLFWFPLQSFSYKNTVEAVTCLFFSDPH